jgi:acyl carrier protein
VDAAAIWNQLVEVIRVTFDDADLVITPQTTARDVEGWDSLSHIQLMVSVEKAFGIRFNTGELTGLANVGELAQIIIGRAAGGCEAVR